MEGKGAGEIESTVGILLTKRGQAVGQASAGLASLGEEEKGEDPSTQGKRKEKPAKATSTNVIGTVDTGLLPGLGGLVRPGILTGGVVWDDKTWNEAVGDNVDGEAEWIVGRGKGKWTHVRRYQDSVANPLKRKTPGSDPGSDQGSHPEPHPNTHSANYSSNPTASRYVTTVTSSASNMYGPFNPASALALGVPKGPLFGKLANGHAVTLPDGRTVTPEEVTGARPKDVHAVIVGCGVSRLKIVPPNSLVIHYVPFAGKSVGYWRSVKEVGEGVENVKHAVVAMSGEGDGGGGAKGWRVSEILRSCWEGVLSGTDREKERERVWGEVTKREVEKAEEVGLEVEERGDGEMYEFKAGKGGTKVGWRAGSDGEGEREGNRLSLDAVREIWGSEYEKREKGKVNEVLSCPELTFYGTGSSVPCPDRNVTCNYITTSHVSLNAMLMDVGENSVGQIYNLYGAKGEQVIERVRCIIISHSHADHCNGIGSFMEEWTRVKGGDGGGAKLVVVAPAAVITWVKACDERLWKGRVPYVAVDAAHTLKGYEGTDQEAQELLRKAGVTELEAVRVSHCNDSYGFTFRTDTHWEDVLYSGDCRPSKVLQERMCKTQIHEATFEEDMWESAVMKRHSTVGEALKVIEGSRFGVLTHFSQRYGKACPELPRGEKGVGEGGEWGRGKVTLAWDGLRLTEGNFDEAARMGKVWERRLVEWEEERKGEKEQDKGKEKEKIEEKKEASEFLNTPGAFAKSFQCEK